MHMHVAGNSSMCVYIFASGCTFVHSYTTAGNSKPGGEVYYACVRGVRLNVKCMLVEQNEMYIVMLGRGN